MRELEHARTQLASVSVSFEVIEHNLNRALGLVQDCYAAYKGATPDIRRQFNQAFFERVFIDQDGGVRHELAKPFKLLLDPGLSEKVAKESRTPRARVHATARSPWWTSRGDITSSDAGGSNFGVLVGDVGIEPTTSSLSSWRSPQLS